MSNECTQKKKAWAKGGKVIMKLEEDEESSHATAM